MKRDLPSQAALDVLAISCIELALCGTNDYI